MALLILLITPLVAILLLRILIKQRTLLEVIAVLSAIIETIAGFSIVLHVAAGEIYNFDNYFSINELGELILGIILIVSCIATLHSVGYLRAEQAKGMIGLSRIREYYMLMQLFIFC